MKQVINGLTYNTETATEIASDNQSGYGPGDFRYRDEQLYKTKKGRFFLAGKGGPMTHWARSVGNASTSGSGIIALSEPEALEWCEQNDVDADVIAEHFKIEEA